MPTNRVPMRKVKRILELHFVANLSVRAIARSVGVGRSSVSRILERARVVNVTWVRQANWRNVAGASPVV